MSRIEQYLVIIERADNCYGAYVPDLPGCVAVGKTEREALKHIEEAIQLHVAGLRRAGVQVAEPTSTHRYVFVQLD
jgi:predicted RNase H-like HicB family nuclease